MCHSISQLLCHERGCSEPVIADWLASLGAGPAAPQAEVDSSWQHGSEAPDTHEPALLQIFMCNGFTHSPLLVPMLRWLAGWREPGLGAIAAFRRLVLRNLTATIMLLHEVNIPISMLMGSPLHSCLFSHPPMAPAQQPMLLSMLKDCHTEQSAVSASWTVLLDIPFMGMTALGHAASLGYLDTVTVLTAIGARVSSASAEPSLQRRMCSPLHLPVFFQQWGCFEHLLTQIGSTQPEHIHEPDGEGYTALIAARISMRPRNFCINAALCTDLPSGLNASRLLCWSATWLLPSS